VAAIDSKIISTIPEIFSVFGSKTFRLLYRGSRDGFKASAFHHCCDGHGNTVSLILSTNDYIFGGYTPLPWRSRDNWVGDPSLMSFIFTIKNPHNLPAQIFKQQRESNAIYDDSSYGPVFGGYSGYSCDLQLSDECGSSNKSSSNIGTTFANNTGRPGTEVLTGEEHFTVEELEVFEVINRE
jgi:hypothetical protein